MKTVMFFTLAILSICFSVIQHWVGKALYHGTVKHYAIFKIRIINESYPHEGIVILALFFIFLVSMLLYIIQSFRD